MSNARTWTFRYYPELSHIIRASIGLINDCYVDFEIISVLGTTGDDGRGLEFQKRGAVCSPSSTPDIEDAERAAEGSLKWDGCMNVTIEPDSGAMTHFCGKDDAVRLGILLGKVYDFGRDMIPGWEGE